MKHPVIIAVMNVYLIAALFHLLPHHFLYRIRTVFAGNRRGADHKRTNAGMGLWRNRKVFCRVLDERNAPFCCLGSHCKMLFASNHRQGFLWQNQLPSLLFLMKL